MLDPAIHKFLSERIHKRTDFKIKEILKKNGVIKDSDKLSIEAEAKDEYSLNNWLLYCAKNANGISMTTHPCKFSHPDAKTSPIYFKRKIVNQGYVHSGYSSETDVIFSTAAYMPIYSFLKLVLSDGTDILDHLIQDTDVVRQQFTIVDDYDYDFVRLQLLKVISEDSDVITSEKVKQVYFPVEDDYHLLSIVSSSVIIFDFKKRIKIINSYEENKLLIEAKKNNVFFDGSYKSLFELTMQGHVKSNPQCISQLNKDNFGESYLLESTPPSIKNRNIHFPKSDFFIESFKKYDYSDTFKELHKLFAADHNNINIRNARDYYLQDIIDLLIEKMWAVRAVSQEQYHQETSSLSNHQKIWLHSDFSEQRENTVQWLDKLVSEIARWLSRSYEKVLGKKAIKLGEEERLLFSNIVEQNRESLK